ncbi:MAG: PLP-dependent aspartate aminotransferase family protein [Proteobacteria bacterium]|nr:PLP-dependent aspartate aminotransferase family protein [Pseudomonadota bacterium]MBU4296153.1 PLP-dependent aspartate aminotransferase family protein [Pseudomonadota bacterium]MCG2746777.1 PLP-dependent aspartate aminotransferase family protein [Desulfobulbaceae bacterium]
MKKGQKFGTQCVHAGEVPDPSHGAHTTPIYQTSTFVFENAEQGALRFAGKEKGYTYTRLMPNTPTHTAFVEKIAALEGGETGQTFSSGMAAITAVALSYLQQGDHLLSTDVVYGGTYELFSSILTKFGIHVSFVDTSNLETVKKNIQRNTRIIFLETPANPTMMVCDIDEIGAIARDIGALLVVDNTFATPCFQRPLTLGADAVVHSCTKYIGGHADLIGGIVVGKKEFINGMASVVNSTGGTMGPHEAWLCIRGVKTLHIRMEKHSSNAMNVAEFLEAHPKIEWVRYPGLPSHPQHEIAKKQMSGFGGMISFGIKGGTEAGRKLMNSVELCSLAVSLGAVDTLIEHPASMTHLNVPVEVRRKAGITDDLVRISVGIEEFEDIIADLDQALMKI